MSPDPLGAVDLTLKPRRPGAASITAHVVEGGGVDLWVDDRGVYEIPPLGHRYTDQACIQEVRLLCLAVIEGRFEATVWRKRGVMVRSHARAEVPGGMPWSYWATWSNPLVRAVKQLEATAALGRAMMAAPVSRSIAPSKVLAAFRGSRCPRRSEPPRSPTVRPPGLR